MRAIRATLRTQGTLVRREASQRKQRGLTAHRKGGAVGRFGAGAAAAASSGGGGVELDCAAAASFGGGGVELDCAAAASSGGGGVECDRAAAASSSNGECARAWGIRAV